MHYVLTYCKMYPVTQGNIGSNETLPYCAYNIQRNCVR